MFDAIVTKNECIENIRKWFEENSQNGNAIIGISGGKDSTIAAALCVEALGKSKVIGVLMPYDHKQDPLAEKLVERLGIKAYECGITEIVYTTVLALKLSLEYNDAESIEKISKQTQINLPARVRMNVLRTYAQCLNGRVINTCNASENYIGYSTVDGDASGDYSPLHNLTVTEVKQIGYALGLPKEFIEAVPSDGLCGMTDEENFGFTYDVLDKYIRTGVCDDAAIKERIDTMHDKNLFKLLSIASYRPSFLDEKVNDGEDN